MIYFSIIYMRLELDVVTMEMLGLPKLPFFIASAQKALGSGEGVEATGRIHDGMNLEASVSILLQVII
ncbi:hypothetical protein KP509_12G084100 [Ceratopteris richardii]|uniref:Uncharacterized protein n=1 Tax=Ceratopteris richardii TaxID=49495 RepID=A0A8T2TMR3_CERRI|nr:hypothetical protein KP509_12G084100 [Ceratopteris richardii]